MIDLCGNLQLRLSLQVLLPRHRAMVPRQLPSACQNARCGALCRHPRGRTAGQAGARVAGDGQEGGKAGRGIRPTALLPEQTLVRWGQLILLGLVPSLYLLGRRR